MFRQQSLHIFLPLVSFTCHQSGPSTKSCRLLCLVRVPKLQHNVQRLGWVYSISRFNSRIAILWIILASASRSKRVREPTQPETVSLPPVFGLSSLGFCRNMAVPSSSRFFIHSRDKRADQTGDPGKCHDDLPLHTHSKPPALLFFLYFDASRVFSFLSTGWSHNTWNPKMPGEAFHTCAWGKMNRGSQFITNHE